MSELKLNNTTDQKNELKDPLLPAEHVADTKSSPSSRSRLSRLGLLCITFNSAITVNRSHNDTWLGAFIVSMYIDLLLLFFCLKKFEETPRNSPLRIRLKIAIWFLCAFLTVMFSYQVAALMPPAVAIIVWVMSLSTGFYLSFIIYREVDVENNVSSGGEVDVENNVSSGDAKPTAKMVEGP